MSDIRDPATDLGPSIVDGAILRHSASALEAADTRQGEGGCPRKWFYSKVDPLGKLRAKGNYAAEKNAGTAMHESFKDYLRTGDTALLTGDAMRAYHLLPPPGADLQTERSIHECVPAPKSPHAPNGLVARSPLELDGVPYVGYMDLVHERAVNYGCEHDEDPRDPPGTIEILDFKRKKTPTSKRTGISLVPHPNDLRHKIQMAGYGMWAFRATRATHVRLSHLVVFADSTPPRKITKLHVLDDLLPTWEYAGVLARVVTDAARETNPDQVPFNKASCDAYGGCPHREHCRAFKMTSLSGVLNEGDLVGLVEQMAAIQNAQVAAQPGMMTGLPVVAGPQMTLPTSAPMPLPVAAPVVDPSAAQRAALEAEEAKLRAQAMQTQAMATPPAPVAPPAEAPILAKLRLINSANLGSPAMAQEVAQAYAQACGIPLGPQGGFAGTGQLGGFTLFALSQVDEMIAGLRGNGSLPPAPIAPPAAGILPPDAPASRPELATAGEPAPPKPEGDKKKRGPGRPPGSGKKKSGGAPGASVVETDAAGNEEVEIDAIFVDCSPTFPCESLDAHFDAVCDTLVKSYCVTAEGKPDVQDIRCPPEGGKLSHGKWKGAVAELIGATPLPEGPYVFKTYGDELRRIAADAYRRIALARSALFVRG